MDTAEFDCFADEYDLMHEKSIAITGEKPKFFHEYKIKVLVGSRNNALFGPKVFWISAQGLAILLLSSTAIFSTAQLFSADVSQRSLNVAESRFAGMATGLRIEESRIPAKDDAFDISSSSSNRKGCSKTLERPDIVAVVNKYLTIF